jgi:adenine-specific DNA-methyltransferase
VALDLDRDSFRWGEAQVAPGAEVIIKYMGNKRQLLPVLLPALSRFLTGRGTFLDLFAGTHSVGYALRDQATVWANDIQAYSAVLGEALLQPRALAVDSAQQKVESILRRAEGLYEEAAALFAYYIAHERRILALAQADPHQALRRLNALHAAYRRFLVDSGEEPPRRLEPLVRRTRAGLATQPPLMATLYWAGTYFGLEQCLWLDALRAAIDELSPGEAMRAPSLAALLHAAARCTSGTGHFAQHRKLTSVSVLLDVIKYRQKSVRAAWTHKVQQLVRVAPTKSFRHRVTCLDFREVIKMPLDVDVVYADPPYSKVHYSRFYHVLESLALYDYPGAEYDGRYRPRALRHQSPFSIAGLAEDAFRTLIEAVASADVPLVISYSSTGVVPLDRLRRICRHRFKFVETASQAHVHNTMGRRGDRDRAVREVLITCHQ